MKPSELIKSFIKSAKWSPYKDGAGRPISGHKWITRKQADFLADLVNREDDRQHVTGYSLLIDDYFVRIGKCAPNGCRSISIELKNEVPHEYAE